METLGSCLWNRRWCHPWRSLHFVYILSCQFLVSTKCTHQIEERWSSNDRRQRLWSTGAISIGETRHVGRRQPDVWNPRFPSDEAPLHQKHQSRWRPMCWSEWKVLERLYVPVSGVTLSSKRKKRWSAPVMNATAVLIFASVDMKRIRTANFLFASYFTLLQVCEATWHL